MECLKHLGRWWGWGEGAEHCVFNSLVLLLCVSAKYFKCHCFFIFKVVVELL